jgi:hypothetical protein
VDGPVGAQRHRLFQRPGVAAGGDHLPGSQQLGGLYGQAAHDSGGAQDEHPLAGLQRGPPGQRQPRGPIHLLNGMDMFK